MNRPIRTVAILGGGPAGSSLATYLARAGLTVVVFNKGKRPPIIVGESMVPAIIPFLRELGVEDEVAGYSIWKGGATFILDSDRSLSFRFHEVRGCHTTYSYNVPRDRFDTSIADAARRAGAHFVERTARIRRDGERVLLSDETLAAAGGLLDGQPDLVVDAGGRQRHVARLFELPTTVGDRNDTALHAHLEGVRVEIEGNVHTDRLRDGWAWRIPLPGRVSLGLVLDSDRAAQYGDSNEERFDNYLRSDPIIRDWAAPAKRITPVLEYSNYQLRAERGVGENWALVGDAFGFVDPVFSSGLLIAFEGARDLAEAILSERPDAMQRYERTTVHRLACWHRIIGYFYDGRLLTLLQVGRTVRETWWGKLMDFHFRKHMPRIFTGEDATNPYSQGLVGFMVKHGLYGHDPEELRIGPHPHPERATPIPVAVPELRQSA